MRVQCSQCGKVFEVPATQTNRALKCVCKNIFIAQPMMEEVKVESPETPDKGSGPWKELGNTREFVKRYQTSETPHESDDATVTTATSDSEIAKHISLLKARRISQEIPKEDNPSPQILRNHDFEIELDQRQEPTPKDATSKATPDEADSTEEFFTSRLDNSPSIDEAKERVSSKDKSPNTESRSAPREAAKPKPNPKIATSIVSLSNPMKIWIIAGGLLVIIGFLGSLIYLWTRPKAEEVVQVDPYLNKLIGSPKNTTNENKPMSIAKSSPSSGSLNPNDQNARPAADKQEVASPSRHPKKADDLESILPAYMAGDFQEAIRLFQSIKVPSPEAKSIYFESLLQRAGDNSTRIRQVLRQVEDELRIHPSSPDLMRSKAFALLQLATDNISIRVPRELLMSLSQTHPFDPLIFAYLGMLYARVGEVKLTRAPWDRALSIEPHLLWLIELQKDYFFEVGEPEEALRVVLKLVEKAGQEARGYRLAGDIRLAQGQTDKGIELLQKSLEYHEDSETRLKLAEALVDKDPNLALTHVTKVLDRKARTNASQKIEAQRLSARLHCKLGNAQLGSKAYASLLRQKRLKQYAAEKADCEYQGGLLVSATESYEEALKLDANNAELWVRYSRVLLKRKRIKASIEASRRSLKIKESDSAHTAAALALIADQKTSEAKAHIRRALQLNPKNVEALALRKKVK